ncbi:T-box protein 2-like [Dendronephthya gigantea]|uniref:T-box protein 2-like n=1 Tax=Dendronephthya gigantea TaxID=151771 RepID=UPI00106B06B9|nr:T-box protein 2-like [Dendronephthya gigantea]
MSEGFVYDTITSQSVRPTNNKQSILSAKDIAQKSTQMASIKDVFLPNKNSLPCKMKHLADLKAELGNEALWEIFHAEGHEMKITNTGRSLFPVLMVKLAGLSLTEKYSVSVNFSNVDTARYRYLPTKNEWHQFFLAEREVTTKGGRRLYEHPNSPAFGAFWTAQVLTFDKLRLINNLNKTDKHMIHVSSLRKYRIQVIVTKLTCSHCHQPHVRMIELPLTEFIAVTGYRNSKITRLKIEMNPLSAAFRESYKTRRAARKRNLEALHDQCANKKLKQDDDVTNADMNRSCSLKEREERPRRSCCKTSPDTLTSQDAPFIDLTDHVKTFLQHDAVPPPPPNDITIYPHFHQLLNPINGSEQLMIDNIPQLCTPEIDSQYPRIVPPGFESLEQYAYDCDFQSYCQKYDDFTSPFQYTEWDTLYY